MTKRKILSAAHRLELLDDDMSVLVDYIEARQDDHDAAVTAGNDDEADRLAEDLERAEEKRRALEMRRTPLEQAAEAEAAQAREAEGKQLSREANQRRAALVAALETAHQKAAELEAALAAVGDQDVIRWATNARQANEHGVSVERGSLTGGRELAAKLHTAGRRATWIADSMNSRVLGLW
ncbi:hypothetical protein LY622_21275 [Halomonas sp. M5N1S17]|uniref:hypothetical protein n=1 Tax=Halomonas alkalisoli TaxID=2907158 RepID=UPI001F173E7A|nr:hypothetical protein [Halomonas alkalisoli]MCE9665966.1 hypothetical protein [Halomonas alkalisoli]